MRRAIVAILLACGSPDPVAPPRREPIAAKPPVAPDAFVAPGFVGVITSAESVDIAPRFSGVIATVLVHTGDSVIAGQIVAAMDAKSMQEELRAAEASLGAASAAARQAEVDVEDARHKLALETRAVADGVSPKTALDEAELGVKRALAAASRASSAVAAESSHVQTARDHVSDLALRAPTDGTIDRRYKDPGATVAAGAPIVRIVGHGGLRLRFAVPPDDAGHLAIGGEIHVAIDTIAAPAAATIRQIAPTLDAASGMIIVEAELDTPPAEVRPGLAAVVR